MSEPEGFLRTEAKARKANDDGIWELLEEAANEMLPLPTVAFRWTRSSSSNSLISWLRGPKTINDHSSP